jgi:hypothetical protein
MPTDPLYLDGSQPYHRHPNQGPRIFRDQEECSHFADLEDSPEPVPVFVFDADALTAHDDAIRQEAEQGLTDGPLYNEDEWEFAILQTPEPGQDVAEVRVMAGWTDTGEFRRYVTAERLVRLFRDHIEAQR